MARVARRNLSFWKKVGSNVKSTRKWRGVSDIEASERLQIDIKRYRKIERGQTESVTLGEIMNVIRIFECPVEQIIPSV